MQCSSKGNQLERGIPERLCTCALSYLILVLWCRLCVSGPSSSKNCTRYKKLKLRQGGDRSSGSTFLFTLLNLSLEPEGPKSVPIHLAGAMRTFMLYISTDWSCSLQVCTTNTLWKRFFVVQRLLGHWVFAGTGHGTPLSHRRLLDLLRECVAQPNERRQYSAPLLAYPP